MKRKGVSCFTSVNIDIHEFAKVERLTYENYQRQSGERIIRRVEIFQIVFLELNETVEIRSIVIQDYVTWLLFTLNKCKGNVFGLR